MVGGGEREMGGGGGGCPRSRAFVVCCVAAASPAARRGPSSPVAWSRSASPVARPGWVSRTGALPPVRYSCTCMAASVLPSTGLSPTAGVRSQLISVLRSELLPCPHAVSATECSCGGGSSRGPRARPTARASLRPSWKAQPKSAPLMSSTAAPVELPGGSARPNTPPCCARRSSSSSRCCGSSVGIVGPRSDMASPRSNEGLKGEREACFISGFEKLLFVRKKLRFFRAAGTQVCAGVGGWVGGGQIFFTPSRLPGETGEV